eukprot:scaffold143300_cov19-Tisochrysis_lutea.AAC.2
MWPGQFSAVAGSIKCRGRTNRVPWPGQLSAVAGSIQSCGRVNRVLWLGQFSAVAGSMSAVAGSNECCVNERRCVEKLSAHKRRLESVLSHDVEAPVALGGSNVGLSKEDPRVQRKCVCVPSRADVNMCGNA